MNEQPLQTSLEESGGVPDVWRDEVQARLERYKRRRGRRIEGAFTMRFPFPPEEPAATASAEENQEPAAEPFASADLAIDLAVTENSDISPIALEPPSEAEEILADEQKAEVDKPSVSAVVASPAPAKEPEPKDEPLRLIELPPRPLPRRKVIAFPKPPQAQSEFIRRIADPVQPEQLRILEVPEELQAMPATPFLDGLLDAPPAFAPELRSDGLELPCPTLRASRRISGAAIDAALTLAGAGMFAAASARFLPGLPPMKFLIAGVVAVSVLLWASYQYLFLVYRGCTPGMTATRVCLRTFKGRPLEFRQRQLRVAGLYLSVLSLGMGLLWYFVDVESLCWHDRISQTFPAAADKS
jgi:uncharacterized RDD family membrane protein YckC